MNYTPITEENVEKAATLYMNHYNQHSGGCWTYEKAYKRIHQMVTMEDSLCLMQEDDNDIPTGLVIGFLESYDEFTFYYLRTRGMADSFSKKWNSVCGNVVHR